MTIKALEDTVNKILLEYDETDPIAKLAHDLNQLRKGFNHMMNDASNLVPMEEKRELTLKIHSNLEELIDYIKSFSKESKRLNEMPTSQLRYNDATGMFEPIDGGTPS